jgi:RHH-type transcriptional regulator, proline utilization regulon repressor / proline dehydrogenase / delta 1-pyrroline-5-carboxylate dehydrogenase
VTALNDRIVERGQALYTALRGDKPSIFEESRWTGKILTWSLKDDDLRTAWLRFVDVFPTLTTSAALIRHADEYFGGLKNLPAPIRWGLVLSANAGRPVQALFAASVRYAVKKLGEQFIIGETQTAAVRNLSRVRREGCAFSVDILGEAVLSETEAAEYGRLYTDLIDGLSKAEDGWPALGRDEDKDRDLDWGCQPKINLSLKPTSLYSQSRPQNFDGSVNVMVARIRPIYERILAAGGSLCIDMESYQYKDMSIEIFKRLRTEFPSGSALSIALQAYLRETERDVASLIEWSRGKGLPIAIRLVKGAYWDYEVLRSHQFGWTLPVYSEKSDTDASFETLARLILENHDTAYLACGSHNIRSIAAVLETAEELAVPDDRFEFQVLYGMAEPIRRLLTETTGRVRLYSPYGRIVPGMAYLVRRLLENTANQSFLRLLFSEETDIGRLLEDPSSRTVATPMGGEPDSFANQPVADFTLKEERDRMNDALASVRRSLGFTCPLFIEGADRMTADLLPSVNPADPSEVIASVAQAGTSDVSDAIVAAHAAFGPWRDKDSSARVGYLKAAASWMRNNRYELAAWQILEIGKQWDQASADVAEAIDFLEYYGKEIERLGKGVRIPSPPGETNDYLYTPRGVAAVIAPWNFPLAITTGMVSAAIVTGNCVVYKPSPLTPVIGRQLVEAFTAAGLPHGVFNYVPGRTEVIAEYLVSHPLVETIAFTGSTSVGLRIIESAAVVREGQTAVKRIICEMGGKNAIIIDDDADLDEAVPGVIASAFGFQGQKCSSCSRVIVLDGVYDAFVARLIDAVRSMPIGPAHDPAFVMGPVSDGQAQRRISGYRDLAAVEGKILYSGEVPAGANYAPVTIVGDIRPEHRIAREEIFGPVLAVMKVKTFDEALVWANATKFALTGGVYSRSPHHLEEARKRFLVGNLYLNRQITGALVNRQPFGGFKMSGLGTKAGGPEYLLHFMDPRVITENTARHGFSPDVR